MSNHALTIAEVVSLGNQVLDDNQTKLRLILVDESGTEIDLGGATTPEGSDILLTGLTPLDSEDSTEILATDDVTLAIAKLIRSGSVNFVTLSGLIDEVNVAIGLLDGRITALEA